MEHVSVDGVAADEVAAVVVGTDGLERNAEAPMEPVDVNKLKLKGGQMKLQSFNEITFCRFTAVKKHN